MNIIKQKIKITLSVICSFILALLVITPTSASSIPAIYLNELYANGAYYYNPCGGVNNSNSGGSYGGTFNGGENQDKIIDWFASAGIDGISDNPAAIAGILGNFYAESGYNPYSHTSGTSYYGVYQTDVQSLINAVTAIGDYWGQTAPEEANDKALDLELSMLVNNKLWTGEPRFSDYVNGVKKYSKTGEEGASLYAEIFEVAVERAIADSPKGGANSKLSATAEQFAASIGRNLVNRYWQGLSKRMEVAAQVYPSVVERISSSSGGSGISGSSSSSTPSVNTADLIDSDGWFKEGSITGLTQESALSSEWLSKLKETPSETYNNGKGKPTAILLHYTAGPGSPDRTSGLSIYGDNLYPAHFTIDLIEKKAWQHFPLNRPSLATKYADQYSIQFEIVGWGYNEKPGDKYDLASFGDAEWDYLAQYLIPISAYTGIPLTSDVPWEDPNWEVDNFTQRDLNLSGVIGHMHVQDDKIDPGNIWPQVQAAIERGGGGSTGTDICGNSISTASSGSVAALQETVLKYAWPDTGHGTTPTSAYAELVKQRNAQGLYTGGGVTDCGGWVTALMQESGWDPDYNKNKDDTSGQLTYLQDRSNGWEEIHPSNASDLQPGDVAVNSHHTWAFVGDIPGFATQIASASLGGRSPQAGTESLNYDNPHWFRKVK